MKKNTEANIDFYKIYQLFLQDPESLVDNIPHLWNIDTLEMEVANTKGVFVEFFDHLREEQNSYWDWDYYVERPEWADITKELHKKYQKPIEDLSEYLFIKDIREFFCSSEFNSKFSYQKRADWIYEVIEQKELEEKGKGWKWYFQQWHLPPRKDQTYHWHGKKKVPSTYLRGIKGSNTGHRFIQLHPELRDRVWKTGGYKVFYRFHRSDLIYIEKWMGAELFDLFLMWCLKKHRIVRVDMAVTLTYKEVYPFLANLGSKDIKDFLPYGFLLLARKSNNENFQDRLLTAFNPKDFSPDNLPFYDSTFFEEFIHEKKNQAASSKQPPFQYAAFDFYKDFLPFVKGNGEARDLKRERLNFLDKLFTVVEKNQEFNSEQFPFSSIQMAKKAINIQGNYTDIRGTGSFASKYSGLTHSFIVYDKKVQSQLIEKGLEKKYDMDKDTQVSSERGKQRQFYIEQPWAWRFEFKTYGRDFFKKTFPKKEYLYNDGISIYPPYKFGSEEDHWHLTFREYVSSKLKDYFYEEIYNTAAYFRYIFEENIDFREHIRNFLIKKWRTKEELDYYRNNKQELTKEIEQDE